HSARRRPARPGRADADPGARRGDGPGRVPRPAHGRASAGSRRALVRRAHPADGRRRAPGFRELRGQLLGIRRGRASRASWCHGFRGVRAGTRASTPRSRVRGGAHGDLVAAQWRPRSRGTLPAPRGGPATEYERVLRCPVRFRQHETGVLVGRDDLARPLPTANPEAAEAPPAPPGRPPAEPGAPVAVRLATAVEGALARGKRTDRGTVARSLGMSGKTLARRLATEGCLFRDVVDEVRRGLGERLLGQELDL